MSPILLRPVREQIEHDRIIRLLHARLKGEYEVESNLGDDRRATLRIGPRVHFPDIVLTAAGAPKKVLGVVEVETGESVNHLEAMAQWAHFGRARSAFYLYIPVSAVDIAKRLIDEYKISVTELWSYAPAGDRIHFWFVRGWGGSSTPTATEFSVPVDGGHLAPRPDDSDSEPDKSAATEAPTPKVEKGSKGPKAPAPAVAKPTEKPARPAPEPKVAPKIPAKPTAVVARPVPKPAAKPIKKAVAPKPAKPSKPVKAVKPVKKTVSPARASKAPKAVKKAPSKPVKSKPAAKKATVKAKGPAKKPAAKRPAPAKKRR